MVKLVKDFLLPANQDFVFQTIRDKVPFYLNREEKGEGYHILEEIKESTRLYRKARIEKRSFLNKFPSFIRDQLPVALLETSTKLQEENIFWEEEKKLQWQICSLVDDIYVLSGTTKFLPVDDFQCKVMVLINLELRHLEHYFPNQITRNLVTPFIQSKIPSYFIDNLKQVYREIIKEEHQKSTLGEEDT